MDQAGLNSNRIPRAIFDQLSEVARAASLNAHAQYSNFRVGAAVLTKDGAIIPGCNVENASFGLAICAERNAVFRAVADGHRQLRAVLIYTPTQSPTSPCGACRQVLHEFAPFADVIAISDGPELLETTVADLLPNAFGPKSL